MPRFCFGVKSARQRTPLVEIHADDGGFDPIPGNGTLLFAFMAAGRSVLEILGLGSAVVSYAVFSAQILWMPGVSFDFLS